MNLSQHPFQFFINTTVRVAFLDDDAQFLDALATSLNGLNAQYFTRQRDLDEALERTSEIRKADRQFLRSLGDPDSFNRLGQVFDYLKNPGRSAIFHIIVVDHMMPGERGRDFCARHRDDRVFRILLTGAAQDDLAVQAFNAGDIDYFVPKQTRGLRNTLTRVLDDVQLRLYTAHCHRARSLVNAQAMAALDTSSVQQALKALLKEYDVAEHILVPQPLGLAALTSAAKPLWIQFETPRSQRELLDLLPETIVSPDVIAAVDTGTHTANVEAAAQLGGSVCTAVLQPLGDNAELAAAVFDLPPPSTTPA